MVEKVTQLVDHPPLHAQLVLGNTPASCITRLRETMCLEDELAISQKSPPGTHLNP
jgi:hypothetical protein